MAKITSPVWSHISGSICGTTYLTTSAGQIIGRQRTVPVDTPTNFKTYIRNAMSTRASHWNALTSGQRAGWDAWAIANGIASGREAYMSGTTFMQFVDNTTLAGVMTGLRDDAPDTNNSVQVVVSPAAPVTPSPGAIAVKIRNTGPMRVYAYVEISPGMNPARNYYKGPWVTAQSKAFSIASGVTPVTDFIGLTVGLKYFSRVRCVTADVTPGLRGNRVGALYYTNMIAVLVP